MGYSKNLFELAGCMRHFGVGARFTRNIWHFPDTYWQLTRYGDPPLVICISSRIEIEQALCCAPGTLLP